MFFLFFPGGRVPSAEDEWTREEGQNRNRPIYKVKVKIYKLNIQNYFKLHALAFDLCERFDYFLTLVLSDFGVSSLRNVPVMSRYFAR